MKMKMMLNILSIDILREIVSYLDVGDALSLSQVDRFLRGVLINDHHLWLSRLQDGLKVRVNRERRKDPFGEVVKRVRTHRCDDCKAMEGGFSRPFMDPFFNKLLCRQCRDQQKYMIVNVGIAKSKYFLNEDDLLPLRTISVENPYRPWAPPMRLYSFEDIRKISEEKLLSIGKSREQRIGEQRRRRAAARKGHKRARAIRTKELFDVLNLHSLPSDIGLSHLADRFIKGGWRNRRERIRWTVDDVIRYNSLD